MFRDWERGDFSRMPQLFAPDMQFTTMQPEARFGNAWAGRNHPLDARLPGYVGQPGEGEVLDVERWPELRREHFVRGVPTTL